MTQGRKAYLIAYLIPINNNSTRGRGGHESPRWIRALGRGDGRTNRDLWIPPPKSLPGFLMVGGRGDSLAYSSWRGRERDDERRLVLTFCINSTRAFITKLGEERGDALKVRGLKFVEKEQGFFLVKQPCFLTVPTPPLATSQRDMSSSIPVGSGRGVAIPSPAGSAQDAGVEDGSGACGHSNVFAPPSLRCKFVTTCKSAGSAGASRLTASLSRSIEMSCALRSRYGVLWCTSTVAMSD